MAKRLTTKEIEPLAQVFDCINQNKSFVLEAGAGSGKTRSLIDALKHVLLNKGDVLEKNNEQIVCITYTNVAKDEISERIESNPLVLVGTIHEFLWQAIRNYQNEIKAEILEFNRANAKDSIADLETLLDELVITYSQYGRKFDKGEITHDDVIEFASKIFSRYPKILKIIGDKYPYIFVDEYQDTQESTVHLLLQNLLPANPEGLVIGFFGDSMQNIYETGVGKIPSQYVSNGSLTFITKTENFRSSKSVVNLLNKIRPSLVQTVIKEEVEGEAILVNCNNDLNNLSNYDKTVGYLQAKGWDFNSSSTKVLLLTHKNIAGRAGYENILDTYAILSSFGRDRLISKEEAYSDFFLNKVERLVHSYKEGSFSEFIRLLGIEGFKMSSHSDKTKIQELMVELISKRDTGKVKDVLEFALDNNLVSKTSKVEKFEELLQLGEDEKIESKKEFHEKLMEIPYKEFILLYKFIEGSTPYSTKHGVKGAEFNNVLLVIDDAHKWYLYNKFNDVIGGKESNPARNTRIMNLLYVCCSRAKERLAVLSLSKMDDQALDTLNNWFGSSNVIDITTV